MQWIKLGLVWGPDGSSPKAKSHAMVPTPFRLNDQVIRIYVTCLDEKGRGRPWYVDVKANDPKSILDISSSPLLEIGSPGHFDDNGVITTSVVRIDRNLIYMYFSGVELCKQVRYRIFSGLAISQDNGNTFSRYQTTPILDRSAGEEFFRSGLYVIRDNNIFKSWYVSGNKWTNLNGKNMPVYALRYLESTDGINWSNSGKICLELTEEDEHGFGRPWIQMSDTNKYHLFYSIRKKSLSAYRLGYAESLDGQSWMRKDRAIGLDVSHGSFDSNAIMYSSTITIDSQIYCFYNGNNFGELGFGLAKLVK
jgi:sucrose-6-phosphate hydrolase SacC (GH32 family)